VVIVVMRLDVSDSFTISSDVGLFDSQQLTPTHTETRTWQRPRLMTIA